jgi:hypothetical protein
LPGATWTIGEKAKKKRKKSPPGGGLESIFLEENRGDKCIMLRCHIFFQLSFQISEISAANISAIPLLLAFFILEPFKHKHIAIPDENWL